MKFIPFPANRFGALLALGLSASSVLAQEFREAPNAGAAPVNQLVMSGNACGPAALLAAFRFGGENWQRAANAIEGANDKERLGKIVREVAMRPSKNLPGRPRWSRSGVNVADLSDMANEMTAGLFLPSVGYEVLFLKPGESQEELLRRVHGRLAKSLDKGLPPVMSIRRFANRKSGWTIMEAHFVTITAVPVKLEKGARSFPVRYLDPWGGKRCEGSVAISDRGFLSGKPRPGQVADPMLSPCLEAVFPQALVGKSKLAQGEATVLTVSAAIGRW